MKLRSVRPTLLDYLSNKKSSNIEIKSEPSSFEEVNTEIPTNNETKPLTEVKKNNEPPQDDKEMSSLSNKKSPKKVITRNRSRRKLKNNNSKSYSSGTVLIFIEIRLIYFFPIQRRLNH